MIIAIEGLIGAGKSTFAYALRAGLLRRRKQVIVYEEPDEREGRNPYLADYYGNPERWSLAMQVHLYSQRVIVQRAAARDREEGGWAVLDRSLEGDRCFAEVQRKRGLMSRREYDTYMRLYEITPAPQVDVYVHLDLGVQQAQTRIRQRMIERSGGRDCESGIPDDYLAALKYEVQQMLTREHTRGARLCPVHYSDPRTTREIYELGDRVAQHLTGGIEAPPIAPGEVGRQGVKGPDGALHRWGA